MRAATYSQRFRFKRVTLVQQEYHKNISSSRGFCRFFLRKNAKKSKFPVPKAFHKCNRLNQDPVNLLRLCCTSPFSGLFRHTLRVAFYFSTLFLQCFSCIFPYVYSLTCIFQSITDFCVRFFRSTPLPQPFSGLQQAFGCTFCNKKQHRQPFQGHLCCAVFLI
jgi:hypothetical protein